jgi:rubrerythrin
MKKFQELTEREVLALAIALEEEDERVYCRLRRRIAAGLSRLGGDV